MSYLEDLLKQAKTTAPQTKEKQERQKQETPEALLVEQYGDVRILQEPGTPLPLYQIPAPHYEGDEKQLIKTIVDLAADAIDPDEALLQTQAEKRNRYYQEIMEIVEKTPELRVPIHAKEFYANAAVREMVGFGLIDPLITDDNLEEIMIIGTDAPIYVFHRKHQMMRTNLRFYEDKDIIDLIDRIARNIGRRIDNQSPLLDARLPDGTRVNATIRPISLNGSTLTLRKFRADPLSIIDLIHHGTISTEAAAFLWLATEGLGAYPANMIIAGGTASGKTTTLNAITGFVPNYERIISIEDTAEIRLPFSHWIRFESRPPGAENTGEIDTDTLLKNALRMRPDRIIVGEIRGSEGKTLFSAMNTGHRGAMGTLHANNAHETLIRLTSPPMDVPTIMLSALNIIIMQHRTYDRRRGLIRRVTEIAELVPTDAAKLPEMQVLYQWDPVSDELKPTGTPSQFANLLSKFTGQTHEVISQELLARAKILAELKNNGTRNMDAVCHTTQNYAVKQAKRPAATQ